MLLNGGENLVATGAGFFNITGFQRESQAFRRGVRLVNRNVAPPNPPVVPQVMVVVVIIILRAILVWAFICVIFSSRGRIVYVRWHINVSIKPSTWRCLT